MESIQTYHQGARTGRSRYRWIEAEIARLDPDRDRDRMSLLASIRLLPPVGRSVFLNLFYALAFMRFCGQLEGAAAVDREGSGLVHRQPDRRAADSVCYLAGWAWTGADSETTAETTGRIKAMHDHYGRSYSMSNETLVHTIAFFALQLDRFLSGVGSPGLGERERMATVLFWRRIGERLGTEEMPEDWKGMERFLADYERSPEWFGHTPQGERAARALLEQFARRWFPPPLRWMGRWIVLSLHEQHVLDALGLSRPPRPFAAGVRRLIRVGVFLQTRVLPDPRELSDPRRAARAIATEPAAA
jgi:hypothetical protein